MPETETSPHVIRVGWSIDASNLTVGEAPLSYGYGGTGKVSCDNKFFNYGEPFSTNDVITCYIDLDANPKTIFFAKNGNYLGVAFRMGPEAAGQVFYPHVTVKNMKFVANFGDAQLYCPPVQGFCPVQLLPTHLVAVPPQCPTRREDCEVLMMVGLPSCGKTTWLEQFVKDHPEKKYYVLGTNAILNKMKVMGLSRKRNYHGRWDALIKQATGILNEMLKVAQRKNRNYILDQTNVYPNARRRKMNNFRGYRHIAVVIVNTNLVLKERNEKVIRVEGKVVPESAIMEMKANFTLPVQGDIFDEVWFVEENQERSQQLVQEFNKEGRAWKEEQKKRPVDDSQMSGDLPPDVKKPKSEPAQFTSPIRHYGTGYGVDKDPYSSVAMTRTVDSYRNAGGHGQNNDSRRWDFQQGRREDYSHWKDNYSTASPPSYPRYHQPFSSESAYHSHRDSLSSAGNEGTSSYHREEWQNKNVNPYQLVPSGAKCEETSYHDPAGRRSYGQQHYHQPQYQSYHGQRTEHNNSRDYRDNFGRQTSDWNTAQWPNNDVCQDYYANRLHKGVQQQPYWHQSQYGNYQ